MFGQTTLHMLREVLENEDEKTAEGTPANGRLASTLDMIGGTRLLLHTIGDDDTPDSVELNAITFGTALLLHRGNHKLDSTKIQRDMCEHLDNLSAGPQFFGALSRRISRGKSRLDEIVANIDYESMNSLCSISVDDGIHSSIDILYEKLGTYECLDIMCRLASGHFTPAQNLLCKEHRMGEGGVGRATMNMTNIIVDYAEALTHLILRHQNLLVPKSICVRDLVKCFLCLKEIVDGPNLENQYYLSSSTPFLSVCNRLVRHIYSNRHQDNNNNNNNSLITLTSMTIIANSMCSTLNCLVEGRTDDIVSTRVSSVLQREALTHRIEEIYHRHVSWKSRTLYGVVDSVLETGKDLTNVLIATATSGSDKSGDGSSGTLVTEKNLEEMEMMEGMSLMTLLLSLSMSNHDLHQMITRNSSATYSRSGDSLMSTRLLSSSSSSAVRQSVPMLGLRYFLKRIGRVDIRTRLDGSLLPVYFPIPEMCLRYTREPLKKTFNECLPRSVENLRRFQDSVHDIYRSMCVEREIERIGFGNIVSGTTWSSGRDALAVLGLIGNIINLFFLDRIPDASIDDTLNLNSTTAGEATIVGAGAGTGTSINATLQYDAVVKAQKVVIALQFFVCVFVVVTRVALTRSVHIGSSSKNISSSKSVRSTTTSTSSRTAARSARAQRRCCCLTSSCCCVQCCTDGCCCSKRCCHGLCCAGAVWDGILMYYVIYMLCMLICLSDWQLGYVIQWIALLDVMIRSETARNVLAAVTSPVRQLALALFLSMIFAYFFALLGFFFFNDDYEMGECQTLRSCFVTTLNQGIRAGGGIGEYMRPTDPFGGDLSDSMVTGQPTDTYAYWVFRTVFDLGFFLMLNIVLLNLVFGIIIDTFAERRFDRQEKDANKKQFCFVCDVSRRKFDQLGIGFKHHTEREHSYEHILFFLIFVFETPPTQRSHAEKLVFRCWEENDISWMPRQDAVSLPRRQPLDMD
jgi:hypothetical protein